MTPRLRYVLCPACKAVWQTYLPGDSDPEVIHRQEHPQCPPKQPRRGMWLKPDRKTVQPEEEVA